MAIAAVAMKSVTSTNTVAAAIADPITHTDTPTTTTHPRRTTTMSRNPTITATTRRGRGMDTMMSGHPRASFSSSGFDFLGSRVRRSAGPFWGFPFQPDAGESRLLWYRPDQMLKHRGDVPG